MFPMTEYFMKTICIAFALLTTACSALAERGQADLRAWLPELPPQSTLTPERRAGHLRKWLPEVHPGMGVSTVLVMLGAPDWGVNTRGRIQWWLDPKKGVLRYSETTRGGDARVVRIYFDTDARVKTIEQNGKVIARIHKWSIWNRPLPRGVFWRP
jgi:hypothetical protein